MDFREKSESKFPGGFEYSKTVFLGSKRPLTITCRVHGDITLTPRKHFSLKFGCVECGIADRGKSRRSGNDNIVSRLSQIHGDKYDFSRVTTDLANSSVEVGCPEHGWVVTSLKNLLKGQKPCIHCRGKNISERLKSRGRESIERDVSSTHYPEYTYDLSTFKRYSEDMRITCPKHGEFWQKPLNHFPHKQGCPRCGTTLSRGENEVAEFLRHQEVEVQQRNRTLIAPRELDIYLPEFNTAIEYNGMYWHADDLTHKISLRKKWELCQEKGIRLINIFEGEWIEHQSAVKSLLLSSIRKSGSRGARTLVVSEITPEQARALLDKEHIQGFLGARFHSGLWDQGELVAVASFGASRFEPGSIELIRYASKGNISGGLNKLIKFAQSKLQFQILVSYCDMRHGNGNSYLSSGFIDCGMTSPDYWWFKGKKRYPRYRCQKHKLKSHPDFMEFYSDDKTESQICQEAGFRKVSGVGHRKFILRFPVEA